VGGGGGGGGRSGRLRTRGARVQRWGRQCQIRRIHGDHVHPDGAYCLAGKGDEGGLRVCAGRVMRGGGCVDGQSRERYCSWVTEYCSTWQGCAVVTACHEAGGARGDARAPRPVRNGAGPSVARRSTRSAARSRLSVPTCAHRAAAAAAERHAAATAVSAWTARWSANGLLLAEPEDFSAGCRRELRRRLRCVKIGRASPGVGGANAGAGGASAGIKKEGGGCGRSRSGAATATARSAPLTPAQAAMLDRRQARVIRNREVALRARRAAKDKMTALVQENGDMAARAASLVAENAALKREVAALRLQLA